MLILIIIINNNITFDKNLKKDYITSVQCLKINDVLYVYSGSKDESTRIIRIKKTRW